MRQEDWNLQTSLGYYGCSWKRTLGRVCLRLSTSLINEPRL